MIAKIIGKKRMIFKNNKKVAIIVCQTLLLCLLIKTIETKKLIGSLKAKEINPMIINKILIGIHNNISLLKKLSNFHSD